MFRKYDGRDGRWRAESFDDRWRGEGGSSLPHSRWWILGSHWSVQVPWILFGLNPNFPRFLLVVSILLNSILFKSKFSWTLTSLLNCLGFLLFYIKIVLDSYWLVVSIVLDSFWSKSVFFWIPIDRLNYSGFSLVKVQISGIFISLNEKCIGFLMVVLSAPYFHWLAPMFWILIGLSQNFRDFYWSKWEVFRILNGCFKCTIFSWVRSNVLDSYWSNWICRDDICLK